MTRGGFPRGILLTTTNPRQQRQQQTTAVKTATAAFGILTLTGCCAASSSYLRERREGELKYVPLASRSGAFYVGNGEGTIGGGLTMGVGGGVGGGGSKRELRELRTLVTRIGLMKGHPSVKEDLEQIRSWHREKGYHGGLVLRELTQALFPHTQPPNDQTLTPSQLPQRECYYLYYEIRPNGHSLHQIFCRGTTVLADVTTCLRFRLVYDEELNLHLHEGFRDHADRLVEDVEPLLGNARGNPRATVEVAGHSLGGAVAMIVAMKLRRRGWNVVRVTSVAGGRFCDEGGRRRIEEGGEGGGLLPEDTLRIEDDLDGVQYCPPWASPVGNKLWFVTGEDGTRSVRYLSQRDISSISADSSSVGEDRRSWEWVDSMWWNCRIFETLCAINRTHRLPSFVSKIEELVEEMGGDGDVNDETACQL